MRKESCICLSVPLTWSSWWLIGWLAGWLLGLLLELAGWLVGLHLETENHVAEDDFDGWFAS